MKGSRYKSILCELMAFRADHNFPTSTVFSQEELLEITPDDVCHWMNYRAFGDRSPTEDANPVNARASTLEYAKKAISSFMPRRTVPWDPIRNEGSMDPRVCVLLNIAVHVEMTGKTSLSSYVFGNLPDGDRVVRRFIQEIFVGSTFHKLKPGNLGTHSLRKGAATYGSRSGLPKVYVNRRGRWRKRKSVVDVYIDNAQPYPDAVAAGALAGPIGPCRYVLKDGVQTVTDDVLIHQVGPVIKEAMGDEVARVLALPLIWASLVPHGSFDCEVIPAALKKRILHAYVNAGGNPSINAVERVPIHVVGEGAQLQLVEVREDAVESGALEHTSGGISADSTRKEFASIHSQLFGMQRQTANVLNEVLRSRAETQRDYQKLLAVRPKDLYELWEEYQFGLSGLKPAKDFTAADRGANKFAYSRRKVFWDAVATFVRSGFTSDVAIDRNYAAYGRQLSVTRILAALRNDKHQGGHPSLRL
ncbi:uncharacterized protein PITG_15602 [Phytophthora infestans T30-4]|uniref:Uncharacterized protein n=1 Tax=Phytophthora infestans (strain T30-4) TaxID=403677 RepID=D0NT57_PHYIT|nr:uncharacterized protein PITG_15602 [Phytophthora infestans T30-4]EEY64813.1 conserved hypothetical protein [Phytophthora infestans T30-4]|eukprot:XP_002897740.1 conserved hypothetical protein [Phytophthora infestans T30-4]